VGREREGAEWVVREGVGAGGEMTQALYAHMNNKRKKKNLFPELSLLQNNARPAHLLCVTGSDRLTKPKTVFEASMHLAN
jgi:hypothetical protein